MNIKQYIIVRKDLKMKHGKMAAQVSHASLGAFLNFFTMDRKRDQDADLFNLNLSFLQNSPMDMWLHGIFTKVILRVDSELELLQLNERLREKGIKTALITDRGLTTFDKPTTTCLGAGPVSSKDVEDIIGHLKLY